MTLFQTIYEAPSIVVQGLYSKFRVKVQTQVSDQEQERDAVLQAVGDQHRHRAHGGAPFAQP